MYSHAKIFWPWYFLLFSTMRGNFHFCLYGTKHFNYDNSWQEPFFFSYPTKGDWVRYCALYLKRRLIFDVLLPFSFFSNNEINSRNFFFFFFGQTPSQLLFLFTTWHAFVSRSFFFLLFYRFNQNVWKSTH